MKVQFRIRSLVVVIVIIGLVLALGIQTIRVRQLEARAQQAIAEEHYARMIAEVSAQRAAQPLPLPPNLTISR